MPELVCKCYMIIDKDSEPIPFENLTTEQINKFRKNASERLSKAMSDYYAQHMDEYIRL